RDGVRAALHRSRRVMRRLEFFGHPLHPATVHFPLGLLVGATAVDVLGWLWPAIDGDAARLMLILGLVAAAPTVATGFLDFLAIAREPAVERTAEIGRASCRERVWG